VIDMGDLVIGEHDRVRLDFAATPQAVGDVHSHPSSFGIPSRRDLRAWSALRRGLGLARYVGVIACGTSNGWALVPWIVRAHGSRDVAERASWLG
jgi:proteasome lid subunit RPN8/RPN11